MERLNQEKGITLIALIITVIIMLILAGTAISVLTSDGGLFQRTKNVVGVYEDGMGNELNQINQLQESLSRYFFDIWDGSSIADNFEKGTGTEEEPYLIKTAPQLIFFREQVNSGVNYDGKFIILGANIELNSGKWTLDPDGNVAFGEEAIQWTPIGFESGKAFKGNFNGDNYRISGLYINNVSEDYRALFGRNFGKIENLIIENSYVKGYVYTSIAVGINDGTLQNIVVKNSNVVGYDFTAGICSKNQNTIIGCTNYANISYYKPENEEENLWGWRLGGICGRQEGTNANVTKCLNYGKIEGTHNTGGIIGSAAYGEISLCVNYGTVKTYLSGRSGQAGGGIIGYASRLSRKLSNKRFI